MPYVRLVADTCFALAIVAIGMVALHWLAFWLMSEILGPSSLW